MSPVLTLGVAVLFVLGLPSLLVLALLVLVLRLMVALVALLGYNTRRAHNAPNHSEDN